MRSRTEKTEDENREVFWREKNDLLYIECTELSKLLTEQSIYTERMNYNSSTN